jgi:recombinational DNA repair protein (RecF pathway)
MQESDTRYCGGCKQEKAITDFYKTKGDTICKACRCAYAKKKYSNMTTEEKAAYRKQQNEYHKVYRAENRERINARKKTYYFNSKNDE